MAIQQKGANQIDFAMAVSVIIIVTAFSVSYVTGYFSRDSSQGKNIELQSAISGVANILFDSAGIPPNWENNNYAPARIGLKGTSNRISIAAAEKAGVNHIFEETDMHIVFDRACANKTYNNSVRVYDQFMNETRFRIYNYTECTANSGFLREANINFLANITGNTSQIFWLYYTNNTATPKKSAYNFSYDNSLVGYWKLDSVNASNYTMDSTQYRNDGKLINYSCNPATCNITSGLINSALRFDGSNDYVNMSNEANFDVSKYSISAWIYLDSTATAKFIASKYCDAACNDISYRFMVNDENRLEVFVNSDAPGNNWLSKKTNMALSAGQWYHVVGTYDGGTTFSSLRLYINGTEITDILTASAGTYTRLYNSAQPFRVGAGKSGAAMTGFFNGTIDEVRIYNRSLSADEIKALYNYTRPNYIISSESVPIITHKKISALQNLSYDDIKNSLDMKKNFNITACEYSFGRHVPDTVNAITSSYPIMLINSSGETKSCLATVNVW